MARPKTKPGPILPPSTERLGQLIEELRLSRVKFANQLGMSSSGINALFLKEGTRVSIVQAKAIECEFHINHRWLLEGEEPKYIHRFSRLRPSEVLVMQLSSFENYPSQDTMVSIPLTLAANVFRRDSLKLIGQLGESGAQSKETMDEVIKWFNNIRQRLERDWEELKQDLPVRGNPAQLLPGLHPDAVPNDQLKQWQTARYYFMDVVVMDDESRPSLEAGMLGIEINQNWIDEHRAAFHQEWRQLCENALRLSNKASGGLIQGD